MELNVQILQLMMGREVRGTNLYIVVYWVTTLLEEVTLSRDHSLIQFVDSRDTVLCSKAVESLHSNMDLLL